jgi:hypothetical protein
MHDFELDPVAQPKSPAGAEAEAAGRSGDVGRALGAGGSAHLDSAAVLHLQRSAGNAGVAQLLADEGQSDETSPVLDIVGRGGGEPLEAGLRSTMEDRLSADFSSVRVHTDGQAAASAQSVNAHAYTVGHDIVFGGGRFDPGTTTGQRTIAHELTHVVQQEAGPVDGSPVGGGIRLSDPADRFERAAEQRAEQVVSGAALPASVPAATGSSVQRDADDEEEESVQGLFVQRDADDEVEEDELSSGA